MNAPMPLTVATDDTLVGIVTDPAAIHDAAVRATRKIAPVWPLKHFVAVNPFFGLSDRRFHEAAEIMARVAGARITMPRGYYLDAIDARRITEDDLEAALDAAPPVDGMPKSVAALVNHAKRTTPKTLAVLPTVADVATETTGADWARIVTEQVSAWAADYFDDGQASWRSANKDEGPYRHWRRAAMIDRTPEILGLKGFRAVVAAMPETAAEAIVEATKRLELTPDAIDGYFHRALMTVGGWAAYARYKVWDNELYGRGDSTLLEFLAVRLSWDAALMSLMKDTPGFVDKWLSAQSAADDAGGRVDLVVDTVLQTALERAWQREVLGRLERPHTAASAGRKTVQAAFCIDVRSEVFRRALEGVTPDVETIGFAGFFGFPIEYVPLGQTYGGAQCPVLLTPKFTVCEAVKDVSPDEESEILGLRIMRRRAAKAWKSFKLAAVSSFAFVETIGLSYVGKLATDGLGISRTVPHPRIDGIDDSVQARLMPRIVPKELDGRQTGFTDETRTDMAEAVLNAMSMTSNFARLVLLAGHGSTTVNNPHATGLDCGACGGYTGEANARVTAAILNDAAVREGLKGRGITIPEDTVFLGALHDTTTDEVRIFDTDAVPESHADDLARLTEWLDLAALKARSERSPLLNLDADRPVTAQIIERSRDWSQVRPEWGLAGCAAFIAAPRHRTAGIDLGGRAFLHSYAWRQDRDFAILELILTAPVVVASWISLQYYGSSVDNRAFGCGNKVLHNVVGTTVGVLEGNGGDLRTGLPWQSLHDGERLIHEPLRLSVVIEAPTEAINAVIERHQMVRELVDNGWLHLFAIPDAGEKLLRYQGELKWS